MPDSSWGQVTVRIPEHAPVTAQAKVGAFEFPDGFPPGPYLQAALDVVRRGGTLRLSQNGRAGGNVLGAEDTEWVHVFPGCQLEFKWACSPGAYPAGGAIWHLGKQVALFAFQEFDEHEPGRLQTLIKGRRRPETNDLDAELMAALPPIKVPENFLELDL
jgi:hypothetical protein